MPEPQPLLIQSLLDPRRYPEPATHVDLVETHASWVLLAGEYAYKIKKPVTLPFLDYGTLEKRRACCALELELNRRFAPTLYLGLAAIGGTPQEPVFGATGTPLEYAVKMRRFDETQRLDRLCAGGALTAAHVSALAGKIAAFHATAALAPSVSRFGTPEQVVAPTLENFEELLRLLPQAAAQPRLLALQAWTHAEARRLEPAFAARKTAGHVRACHGDLHLGNLVLQENSVLLFDCIEFNEDFRWIDVASEIAFTYIDLLDHRQPGLACWLLNEWLGVTGDFSALAVLRFYAVYRALVRAKVAGIRGDVGEALEYLDMAERLATPPAPTLTITFGLSGSGKTTASTRQLLGDTTASTVRLRSDIERKRLFGLAAHDVSGSPLDGGIYDADATRRTYARLAELAAGMLDTGWSVVVDAAFLKHAERQTFRSLAETRAVAFAILACTADVAELRRRIAARRNDASEATLAVLERQLGWMEPLDGDELAARLP